ncbi:P-loop containing nucleoside triphosphate hydrolase protein [Ramaria rubella]|nr:P-loop containing nucleoside triphosphate hydrolase protein [Ramaria rubella]
MANDNFVSDVKAPLLPQSPETESPPKSKEEKDSKESEAIESPPKPEEKKALEFEDVGVWTVMREVDVDSSWRSKLPGRVMLSRWKELIAMFPIFYRFLQECFSVAPNMMVVYLLAALWTSTEDAVGLYFSSRLLNIIQDSIINHKVDGRALIVAVVSRVLFTLMNSVVATAKRRAKQTLVTRVRYLFEERLIHANLRLDLPTFEEPETASKINRYFGRGSHGGAWEILDELISKCTSLTSVASQLSFLFTALRSQPGGFWFAIICLGKSVLDNVSYSSYWSDTSYTWDSNPHYRRMRSLMDIVTTATHRIEVLSDVLINYIQREWKKARTLLADSSDEHPARLLHMERSIFFSFLDTFSEDFPLIFYAFQVYLSPGSFSLTSVALMQQASATLTWTFYGIFNDQKSLQQHIENLKTLYELENIKNTLDDGDLEYPKDTAVSSSGMEIKFENVSFAYPKAENVIKDVSFTIGKGQAVVIVGINGSGKSTLLKLFNRLYDPNSGTITIDGTPIQSFSASTVRQSMAMLFQKYSHYPLPIRENIALGLPDAYASESEDEKKEELLRNDLVEEAARLGGSTELIDKQPNRYDTVLQPSVYGWSTSSTEGGQAFRDKMKEIKKSAEVSLGQWQRLALSRLFFRAAAKYIKLVAVDEPSASLDPKMEYELFERLRSLSTAQGKTMVFVTHRFGYLTKRADLILVMQNGQLVEQGKHNELLKMDGEYAKLFKLQAEAFLPDEKE